MRAGPAGPAASCAATGRADNVQSRRTMIPFRDNIPSRSTPIITICLIVINVIVFIYELSLGDALEPFISRFGVVPSVAVHWPQSELPFLAIVIPYLTS